MAAVYLIIGQSGLVGSITTAEIVQLAALPVIAPETFTLGGKPQIALAVLIDVDGDGIGLAYTDKTIFLSIIQAQAFHGGHPHFATGILIDGIRTGVVKT